VTYVVVVDYAVPPGRGYITKTVPIWMRSMDAAHLAVIFSATSSRSGTAVDRLTHVGAVVRSSGHRVSTYDKLLKIEEALHALATNPELLERASLLVLSQAWEEPHERERVVEVMAREPSEQRGDPSYLDASPLRRLERGEGAVALGRRHGAPSLNRSFSR